MFVLLPKGFVGAWASPFLLAALVIHFACTMREISGQDAKGGSAITPATAIDRIKTLKDFEVELVYAVPKPTHGSWVAMCLDPQGRLIVSDQGGSLYRVTVPPLDGKPSETKVEKIPVDIGDAQGLLWAFDSLYVVVNSKRIQAGLYRVRDTDGNGELDKVEMLRQLEGGGGEHGPHAVLLSPDGKSIMVVCGNQTKLTEFSASRVPPVWGEDHLLPRMPDGRGFMAGVLGPGGAIYKVDPDGKNWEIHCVGFRNEYDAAFNRAGDLFTYDADMEWDFNTPWYRPTRVCLATSGAEFGWRNGTGKWPVHYPDSLPAVMDVGPGSPTGVVFGYGAKFPAKYQEALFICDWSYGKMYAVHLTPSGAGYTAVSEEFVAGSPLPLTDLVVHPDGSLYFAVGGRGTQSALYRVTYTGKEPTTLAATTVKPTEEWKIRRNLETLHSRQDAKAVETAWPHLDSQDRFVRFAARVAVEHQDPTNWRDRALKETRPTAAVNALLALIRVSAPDPHHRNESDPPADPKLRSQIVEALDRLDWERLNETQRLEMLRVYQVLFNRFGKPDDGERERVIAKLNPHFPARDRLTNADLLQVLVFLDAPDVPARTLKLLASAPTQEEQIEYAKSLRMSQSGWTPELRKQYFSWFHKAGSFKGGASFDNFMRNIKTEAVANLSESERLALKPILEAQPTEGSAIVAPPRPFVKKWTLEEVVPLVEKGLKGRDYDRGRTLFGAANCFACHRFNNEGGANGPDLTGLAGRFSARDLLESIVEPSKVISDQYASVVIRTKDGQVHTGRIVNLKVDTYLVNTDMLKPGVTEAIDRNNIDVMQPSKTSMMPAGLLDTLHDDEVLDLMAFLLSRGDRNSPMFQ